MCYDEAEALIKKSEEEYIKEWNQIRYICYSNGSNQFTFPWENEDEKLQVKTKEQLQEYALELEKRMNTING